MNGFDSSGKRQPNTLRQIEALKTLLRRGHYTPSELLVLLKREGIYIAPESVTARIRDLRKAQYGGYTVRKEARDTHFAYYVVEATLFDLEAA